MSELSIWEALGLEETADERAVRRAYAGKLKTTNPEDDPEGFKQLRTAYELALRSCRYRQMEAQAEAREQAAEAAAAGGSVDEAVRLAPAEPVQPISPDEIAQGRILAEARAQGRSEPQVAEPAVDPALADLIALRQRHADACNALGRLVSEPGSDGRGAVEALEALLRGPAMDAIDTHARTEHWVAMLIHHGDQRSDQLIEPAIAYFRWDDERLRARGGPGELVLERRARLDEFRRLGRAGSQHADAFRVLNAKPVGWQRVKNRLAPGLADKVDHLLKKVRRDYPGMESAFDPDALAWWDRQLARTRTGPMTIWACLAGAVFAAGASPVGDFAALFPAQGQGWAFALAFLLAWGAWAAVFLGVVLFRLYGFQWPREQFRARWPDAPAWARLGWAPASMALIVLAGVLPPSMGTSLAVLVAGLLLTSWARIAGDVDRRVFEPAPHAEDGSRAVLLITPFRELPWRMRAGLAAAGLVLMWILAGWDIPSDRYVTMAPAVLAALAAFVVGAGSLGGAWIAAGAGARRVGLAALGLGWAAAAALVLASAVQQPVQAAAAAAVTLTALACTALNYELLGRRQRVRELLDQSLPLWGVAAVFLLPRNGGVALATWVEAWVLASTAASILCSRERAAPTPAASPAE